MSDPKDRDSHSKKPEAPAAAGKKSGRVAVDERGNSVWEWQLETGVYSRDISTQKLRKLDLGELSIAETANQERPAGLGGRAKKLSGGGFNPYDNAGGGRSMQPDPPGTPPPRKPMDLKRLEEWIQIRKRLEQQKKEKKDQDED